DRPLGTVGEDHRDRPRTAESAAGGGAGRRPETDGDPAPSREGAPNHRADRSTILATQLKRASNAKHPAESHSWHPVRPSVRARPAKHDSGQACRATGHGFDLLAVVLASRYPALMASASVMNFPFLVLP